jgi:alkylation response protein AidB-like acyl-CoA dehydrogenase
MSEYRPPLTDLDFLLNHMCDLEGVSKLEGYEAADPATVQALLDEGGKFMAEVIAPLNKLGDVEGARWEDYQVTLPDGWREAYKMTTEAGWNTMGFPAEYGGGNFPFLVETALSELIGSANMSFSMVFGLTTGAIEALIEHADEEQRNTYLPKLITGEWAATMNLTEPQAGSDVGAVRTKAVRQDDGTYRISGQKIFITFGEHDFTDNIIHLVLARTPDAPPGTKGISCFIVPKFVLNPDGSIGEKNDVKCASIEHKMGIRASPTCVMLYGDDSDGAVGYLIGEENQGMHYMFTMMNNARLYVGLSGVALGERSYQMALDYAQERLQGREFGGSRGQQAAIIRHPDVRRMLYTMRAYNEASRNLIFLVAEQIDHREHNPDKDAAETASNLVDLLIPIAKAWSTDIACEVTSLGIQIYGGMGFIEETGVAQHFRDARIQPIYEGTNGIQALDLVGRKLPMAGGKPMIDFVGELKATAHSLSELGDTFAKAQATLESGIAALEQATMWIFENGPADPKDAAAGATPYLNMFGQVAGGWTMAKQALAAHRLLTEGGSAYSDSFLEAKKTTARFYLEQLVPRAGGYLAQVVGGNSILSELTPEQLAG